MIALSLALVIVGLAGIGAAWHVAIRLLDRRLVIAGEAKLREEMAALGVRIGEVNTHVERHDTKIDEHYEQLMALVEDAHALAKKAEERVRNRDVAEKMGGRQ